MPDWVSEHIGEIALLIYILYPLLKRWWGRLKKRQEKGADATAETSAEAPARRKRTAKKSPQPAATDPRHPPAPRPTPSVKRPSEADFVAAASAQLERLKREASAFLSKAQADPRLARLVPALRDDLLGRLELIERSLRNSPTLSTVVQDTTVLRGLGELLRHLRAMAQQRTRGSARVLADADAMADACYAPLLELSRVQGLDLRTSQAVTVTGDWDMSIIPKFASTRVAPLRLPSGFEHSVWRWPSVAHEVAHDFYYSLEGLDPDLRKRLGLPSQVQIPTSEAELGGAWLRELFGAWLPEVFADLMGTVSLGPAYVETMRRAFRNPSSPQRTAAIVPEMALIDEHPPARLRIYMATRALHHLGRHEEADALWEQWENEHPDVRFYYLPLQGNWVGLSDEALHSIADSLVDELVQEPWPELEGFQLLNIPGLAYLHAEHAKVQRLSSELASGQPVDADPRWILAAAVLASAAQPALQESIEDAALRSIRGLIAIAATEEAPSVQLPPSGSIGKSLVASLKHAEAIEDAIILGAAIRPYSRPRWR